MPNTKQPCPAKRLYHQLARLLNGTQARKDDVTEILIGLLAVQLASYDPLLRDDFVDAAILTMEAMIVDLSEQYDASLTAKN